MVFIDLRGGSEGTGGGNKYIWNTLKNNIEASEFFDEETRDFLK